VSSSQLVGKFRKGTSYSVSFPTLPSLKSQPQEVVLTQKQRKHDVLTLEYPFLSPKFVKLLKTGVPVKFTWKQGTRSKTWYGYVSSTSKVQSAQLKRPMKIHCVGASYVLKKKVQKVYKKTTLTNVAAKIAAENKLKLVTQPSPIIFAQLVNPGQSNWEWLQKMAKLIGYVAYISGTSLVFLPIDKAIEKAKGNAALFQLWSEGIPRNTIFLDRTLDKFTVLSGENIEADEFPKANKAVGGVNPVTGKIITAKKSPSTTGKSLRKNKSDSLFDQFLSKVVITNPQYSKQLAEAAAQISKFNLPASAEGQGDPRVAPYAVVKVAGSGEETDGFWVVKESVHFFKRGGDYAVDMVLVTDGTGPDAGTTTSSSSSSSTATSTAGGGTTTASNTVERTSVTANKSTIDVSSILKDDDAVAEQSLTGGVSLAAIVGTTAGATTSGEDATTRLAVKVPTYNQVENQGFLRTPATWENTAPKSPSLTSLRKCRCNCR